MVHFPEELINEILRYALRIYPVEVFTKAHDELHVPHNRERRSKQLLLVCKRWHAIGIAYLYETVEINHGADMERLRNTMQSSSSDRLGPMVRNLRIDGGYGINLRMVTACTLNVRVLSLQLRTAMKYGTKGLPRALAMLNPTELYLHGLVGGREKRTKAESNTEVLLNVMPDWTSLKKITFIQKTCGSFTLPPKLATILSNIPGLWIGGDQPALSELLMLPAFHTIVRNANVPVIVCYGEDECLRQQVEAFPESIPQDVSKLLVYEELE